jgi:hypothetical protein
MHNYLNQELENDTNSLKSLLDSFYNKKNTEDKEKKNNQPQSTTPNENIDNESEIEDNEELNTTNITTKTQQIHKNSKNIKNTKNKDNNTNLDFNEKNENEPTPFQIDDFMTNQIIDIEQDQMSDAGSDIDLDKFEMSL